MVVHLSAAKPAIHLSNDWSVTWHCICQIYGITKWKWTRLLSFQLSIYIYIHVCIYIYTRIIEYTNPLCNIPISDACINQPPLSDHEHPISSGNWGAIPGTVRWVSESAPAAGCRGSPSIQGPARVKHWIVSARQHWSTLDSFIWVPK